MWPIQADRSLWEEEREEREEREKGEKKMCTVMLVADTPSH